MNENEKLIEEAAKSMMVKPEDWSGMSPQAREDFMDCARAALAVFEKAHAREVEELVAQRDHAEAMCQEWIKIAEAHTPTDDEWQSLWDIIANIRDAHRRHADDADSADIADAILAAGFRRSGVPEPSAEEYPDAEGLAALRSNTSEPQGESSDAWFDRQASAIITDRHGSDPTQGEPSDAQVLAQLPFDPQPWVFISDQVFGVRSASDKGFHDVSGAYYVFQPRPGYEQDRTCYEAHHKAQGEPGTECECNLSDGLWRHLSDCPDREPKLEQEES